MPQAYLKLEILLPQLSECRNYRKVPSCLAEISALYSSKQPSGIGTVSPFLSYHQIHKVIRVWSGLGVRLSGRRLAYYAWDSGSRPERWQWQRWCTPQWLLAQMLWGNFLERKVIPSASFFLSVTWNEALMAKRCFLKKVEYFTGTSSASFTVFGEQPWMYRAVFFWTIYLMSYYSLLTCVTQPH